MGTRGSLSARSVFIKEQESCFLTDLPHHQNQREERKLLPRRRQQQVFLNMCFSACRSLQRLQTAGTSPWVLCRKDGVKAVILQSQSTARVCCPKQRLQLLLGQKIRFCTWEKAHNLCKPSLQYASSHFLIAFLQRLLLSNAYFVEKLHHKQPTGKEINNC